MTDTDKDGDMGLFRIIGIVVGLLLAGGFGWCGVMWLQIHAEGRRHGAVSSDMTLQLGLAGIAIAAALVGVVFWIGRKRGPDTDQTKEQ